MVEFAERVSKGGSVGDGHARSEENHKGRNNQVRTEVIDHY